MKIAIIGIPGSGKSTLALKLHKALYIPLYHLDQYFWKPGWQEPNRHEFEQVHNRLCDGNSWIIEGMAIRFCEYRIQRADVVVFIDLPSYKAFYRVFKRALFNYGSVYFSSAKGCHERGPSLTFLKFIWNFTRDKKPIIEGLLEKYKGTKKIFVITHTTELDELVKKIKS